MTCPKCGKELIIGSTLCPDCDVFETPPKNKTKRKLSKRGKRIILFSSMVCAIILLIFAISYALGFVADGEENGNGLNLSYSVKISGDFYYSDGSTLFGTDKKFKNHEIIDKGGQIWALNEYFGELFYVKDDVLCKFSPKKRVKTDILKLPSEKSVALIGKNRAGIYFQIGTDIYFFDASANSISKLSGGEGVIKKGALYVFENKSVYKIKLFDGMREKICSVGDFEKPVFVSGNDIYCINYKEMTVFTLNRKNGERNEIFTCKGHDKISDVSKLNFDGKHLYFTGADGIYKFNIKNGESIAFTETGYVSNICINENRIFLRKFEGASYYTDLSGKVLYKSEK